MRSLPTADDHERLWKLSVAFSVARDQAFRRWKQLGNAGERDWDQDFEVFVQLMYGDFDLDYHLTVAGDSPARNRFIADLTEAVAEELSESGVGEMEVVSLRDSLDDYEYSSIDAALFDSAGPLMTLAIEVALLFLDARGHGADLGLLEQFGDFSRGDREIAAALGVVPRAAAGIEAFLREVGADQVSFAACLSTDPIDSERAADALEQFMFDLRLSVLAHFRANMYDEGDRGHRAAQWLSIVPVLDLVINRVRSRAPKGLRAGRREARDWTVADETIARRMVWEGRTRSEIVKTVDRPERQLVEVIGRAGWDEWSEFELDVLAAALADRVSVNRSMCELLLHRTSEIDDRWGEQTCASRSPWDIALRARHILFGLDAFWSGVKLAAPKDAGPAGFEPDVADPASAVAREQVPVVAAAPADSVKDGADATFATAMVQLPAGTRRVLLRGGEVVALGEVGQTLLRVRKIESMDLVLADPTIDWAVWRDEVRERFPKAYMPWDEEEEERLRAGHGEGLPLRILAERHQRSHGSIRARLERLGLVDPSSRELR